MKIQAWKEKQADGKWLINTDSDQSIQALKHLEQVRVLRQTVGDDLPLPSMMASREERKLHLERVAAQQLERSILSISGILEVHVHLNFGEAIGLFESFNKKTTSSASVVLTAERMLPDLKNEVARLVAGATGMPIDSVAVIITDGAGEAGHTSAVVEVASQSGLLQLKPLIPAGILLGGIGLTLLFLQFKSSNFRQILDKE